MYRFRPGLLAACLMAMSLVACSRQDAASSVEVPASSGKQPDAALAAGLTYLRGNDLAGFLRHVLPAERYEQLRADYEASRADPVPEQDAANFAEQMRRLTGPDAQQQMMDELRPALRQYGPQLPLLIGFGQGMVASAIQQMDTLDAEQKAQAVAATQAIAGWLNGANLGDEAKAEKAVAVIVDTARRMDLPTLEAVRALDFEQMLGKVGLMMSGVKELLAIYGLSIDETLASTRTSVVSRSDDQALVRVDYTLLGTPLHAHMTMVRRGERWYGRELLEGLEP